MKKLLLLFGVCLCMHSICVSQTTSQNKNQSAQKIIQRSGKIPSAATDDWMKAATAKLDKLTYDAKEFNGSYAFVNNKQGLLFGIDDKGVSVITKPIGKEEQWNFSLDLLSIHKNTNIDLSTEVPTLSVTDNYLKYSYKNFATEYINNEDGLRQNFIVTNKPEGKGQLEMQLTVNGTLRPKVVNSVLRLIDKQTNKIYLKYDGLKVWDANNKLLAASMELSGDNQLTIKINDNDAVYPVTIDPLTHAAEWTASAKGVLPGVLNNLALQVDALLGYSLAGVGDVNGDGYDDVAIGAPGAIDVIAGPTTVVGAGAVFIYFGSDTGLATTPTRTLRSTTPVANALFGFSIAGGDVIGDSKSDIVVGAPAESYTTAVTGIPSTATVTAGKVYTFRGQDLASGTSSPFASIYLNGPGFFSNGVLGVLLANVNINALFGFSVSTTGDMNKDGKEEIIVGAPGYAGVQLLDVRTGAAFVYYSGANITGNTPVQLNAPSLLDFPGMLNLNGLLFGFSVDGAGDYDSTGTQDVIVGAPGGLNLNLSGFLGGSAYIYSGKADSSGVNTNITTRLTSSGSILGSVANLFGYKVKGARDGVGKRTGNVIIGAPIGSVLSDVIGGLRLKTGNVYVYHAKKNPSLTETTAQNFSSPRSASLLSILDLQPINVNAMFGASIDNMMDANCDGIGDIIVGEPLSTGVGLIGVNAVGGAAYVFLGNADGTYNSTPYWTLQNNVAYDTLGINAASMIGYSVAGGGHIKGPMKSVRALVGAPGKALDFSSGILNLGNTLGTLLNFTAGNNGLGKAFAYGFNCEININPDVNVTHVNVSVPGNVYTNDNVPALTTYGTPVPFGSNPTGGTINMNTDGSYTFISTTPGIFRYNVPVCVPNFACQNSWLKITVLNTTITLRPPVANTDIASTFTNTPVVIKSLANDAAGNIGGLLVAASVSVTVSPLHGTAVVNASTGDITYTPALNYYGMDTLFYTVSDNTIPAALSAIATQIIKVLPPGDPNTTKAADDFVMTGKGIAATGNVKTNDTDPEGNTQTVAPQNITITGKGTLILNADGSYVFTPDANFTGPVSFTYNTCDNGSPQACANATLYILVNVLVNPDLTPSTRINNGTFIQSLGSVRNFVIEVNEILNNSIDNASAPVQITFTKSDNFNYIFDPAAVSANVPGAITVNNPDWVLVTNTSTTMTFQLKPGISMSGLETSRIYLQMQVLTGAATSTENQTIRIINGSGLEVNYTNNSVVRILNVVN